MHGKTCHLLKMIVDMLVANPIRIQDKAMGIQAIKLVFLGPKLPYNTNRWVYRLLKLSSKDQNSPTIQIDGYTGHQTCLLRTKTPLQYK